MRKLFLFVSLFAVQASAGCPNFSGSYVYEPDTCVRIEVKQTECSKIEITATAGPDSSQTVLNLDTIFRGNEHYTSNYEFRDKTLVTNHVYLGKDQKFASIRVNGNLDKKGNLVFAQKLFDSAGTEVANETIRYLKLNLALENHPQACNARDLSGISKLLILQD